MQKIVHLRTDEMQYRPTWFNVLHRNCVFYTCKVYGIPSLSKPAGTICPTASAQCLCHILVTLADFQAFSL